MTCNIRGGCGATLTASLTLRDRIGACVSVPPTCVAHRHGGDGDDDDHGGDGGDDHGGNDDHGADDHGGDGGDDEGEVST